MRKLTLLATTALAATALAVMAAPAQADREFYLTSQSGGACNPCVESYDGTADLEATSNEYGTCDVRFDALIYTDGTLEATDIDVDSCTGAFASITEACAENWPGQMRLPDSGGVYVDITACIDVDFEGEQRNDITYKIVNRNWDQHGASTMHDPWAFEVADSFYYDTTPNNNIVLHLL